MFTGGPDADDQSVRVLLVDDHPAVRASLKQLLELHDDIAVVGEGCNGIDAVDGVDRHHPDVVVMDMNMPVMNGAEATRLIKEQHPDVGVLALTAFGEMSLVSGMVQAGADGYLLKGGPSEELISSLKAIAEGQGAIGHDVARDVMQNMAELYNKEEERAKAAAELDRMKAEFVSVVSHELRTPLTAINGGVSTLQRRWSEIDDPLKLELLDSMADQCEHLSRMVGQILTVSGIQRGGLGLAPVEFKLGDVALDALNLLESKATHRQVNLNLEDVSAMGDRDRVTEVAISLIENALVFTSGSIDIEVSARRPFAYLRVRDQGPGIEADDLVRMLDRPFVQGDSSTTRSVGGLGLSLYIARQVLENLGGRLSVDSDPETGSTFSMVLPLTPTGY